MATPRIRFRDTGGTLRTIDGSGTTRIRARDTGATLRTITRVRMRDTGGALRIVYDSTGASTFTATPSPATVHGFGIGTATTASTTVTPSGGTGPYTYAWTRQASNGPVNPTANSPTAATTTFTQTTMGAGEVYTSEWRCTVTDSSVPALTATADVTANFVDTTGL